MEAKIRHLEMIQGAIASANGNSFRIKGFAMLLLAGTMAFALQGGDTQIPFIFALILWFIIGTLCFSDLYFIWQSDLFRLLYNDVCEKSENEINFSMDTTPHIDQLNATYEKRLSPQIWGTILLHNGISLMVLAGSLPPFPN